jgi:hypothetical protein
MSSASARVLSSVASAEKPQSVSYVYRKLANTHVSSCALTCGRLLSGRFAGHESVPRNRRLRGRKTCKIARQPACRQNDFVGGRRRCRSLSSGTSAEKSEAVCPQRTVSRVKKSHLLDCSLFHIKLNIKFIK